MRTPEQTVPFEQTQIAPDGLGRNGQIRRQFGDVDFALPPRQGDDLVLPFVCIQPAPPAEKYKRFARACRGPFVTPEKRVAAITA
jgi:hypothetical protein